MSTRCTVTRLLLLGAVLAGLAGCAEDEPLRPVPLRLLGRWENESRSHAGRELVITMTSIRYGQGGSLGETHSIMGAGERIIGGGVVEYDLACVDAFGQPYTLTVVYDGRKGRESMKLKNQSAVQWKRKALT